MSNDYIFFKFRAVNKHLVESLVRPSLYFAKPDALNDPFDCQLDVHKAFERAASTTTGKRNNNLRAALGKGNLFEKFADQFADFGVCAFSLLNEKKGFDEPLLWSHYADEHRGVCLEYRFSMEYLDDPKKIFGTEKVKYDYDVLTKWLADSDVEPTDESFGIELTKLFLTAKHPDWKYEKEVRIIRSAHGLMDIPHGSLEQVCFGLRTPKEDIDLITKLARAYSGCNNFCRVIHASSDFGILEDEITDFD